MGHHNTGDVSQTVEVVLDPRDVDDVEVVGGLVEQQNVGILKHGTGERELHAPSSGEGGGSVLGLGLLVGSESDGSEDLADLVGGAAHGLDLRVVQDVVDAAQVRLLSLDVGLDKDGPDLGDVGESLDLVVGDGPHQGGLSGVVSSEETVVLSTLELHLGVVQENLGSVGEGEGAVAELLGVIVVVVLLGDDEHGLGDLADLLDGSLGVEEGGENGGDELGPLGVLHVSDVHHGGTDDGGMGDGDVQSVGEGLGGKVLLKNLLELGGITAGGHGLLAESLKAGHLGDGALGDLAGLGVGDRVGVGGKSGEEEGEERGGVGRVVDELGHVVDDDGTLPLGGGTLLLQSTEQKGDGHGESGGLDTLDEGDSGELVHDLRNLLGLGDSGDDLSGHVLDILVSDDVASLGHGSGSGDLDLLLGVPHAGGDLGDDLRETLAELLGAVRAERGDHLEGGLAGVPLLLDGEGAEDGGEKTLHGHGGDIGGEGDGAGLGGLTDRGLVVGAVVEDGRKADLDVGLGGGDSGQSGDGVQRGDGLGLVLVGAEGGELEGLLSQSTLDGSIGGDGGGEVRRLPDGKLLHSSYESGHFEK
mmetsp:Transcript_16713/g.31311  ORF Transcript_16713/g.31311 Transcript_16713/m.31311 type:complete len:587 (+) Transcript_16713:1449-3209(+)